MVEANAYGPVESSLLQLIDALLDGAMDFGTFEAAFYDRFHEEGAADALDGASFDFLAMVAEALEYCAPAPDAESIRYGYVTPTQFEAWLRGQRLRYPGPAQRWY